MILTLSKEKVGTPNAPTAWSNEKQKQLPIDYKKAFLESLKGTTLVQPQPSPVSAGPIPDYYELRKQQMNALKYMCDTIDMGAQHYDLANEKAHGASLRASLAVG